MVLTPLLTGFHFCLILVNTSCSYPITNPGFYTYLDFQSWYHKVGPMTRGEKHGRSKHNTSAQQDYCCSNCTERGLSGQSVRVTLVNFFKPQRQHRFLKFAYFRMGFLIPKRIQPQIEAKPNTAIRFFLLLLYSKHFFQYQLTVPSVPFRFARCLKLVRPLPPF